jgi:CDP-glucose 4,6-dehydratase
VESVVNRSDSRFWRYRRVFVTGGTGLLGSCLVRNLYQRGADIVCLVRDWTPGSELVRSGLIDQVTIVRGDVCDQPLLERILAEYEIQTVFHLAAQTIVSVANSSPISTFEVNIGGTWKLMEACRRSHKVQQIVMASSDKAYGTQAILPYDENQPLQGQHPYDVSKSAADLIAQSYAVSYKLPVAITRCGNFFGGGDLNWNRLIPGTIRSVLNGERPVIRSDGQYIRDYIYIEDGALAYILLAEQLAARPELRGQAFNFSNENPMTVQAITQRILHLMDSPLEPVILNQVTNEIREQYLSSTKARQMLQWRPAYSLDEALRQTIDWYRKVLLNV